MVEPLTNRPFKIRGVSEDTETEDGTGFNLDSPWEVEAYSSENELYENYINDGGHYGRRK